MTNRKYTFIFLTVALFFVAILASVLMFFNFLLLDAAAKVENGKVQASVHDEAKSSSMFQDAPSDGYKQADLLDLGKQSVPKIFPKFINRNTDLADARLAVNSTYKIDGLNENGSQKAPIFGGLFRSDRIPNGEVRLTEIFPSVGRPGEIAVIYGEGFDEEENYIIFGRGRGRYLQNGLPDNALGPFPSNNGRITFIIPHIGAGGKLCDRPDECKYIRPDFLKKGSYHIAVLNTNGYSNFLNLGIQTRDSDGIDDDRPKISYVAPNMFGIGDRVTIYGENFSETGNIVEIDGGYVYPLVSENKNRITFILPENLKICRFGPVSCQGLKSTESGFFSLTVENADGERSNSAEIQIFEGGMRETTVIRPEDNRGRAKISPGDLLKISLGAGFDWQFEPSEGGQNLLRQLKLPLESGTQAVFLAVNPGNLTLVGRGVPECRSNVYPCQLPDMAFTVNVSVDGRITDD